MDENMHHLYISVFHEGNIAKSDMDFVMAVKSYEITDPAKTLLNCSEILEYFSEDEFRSSSFINYDMLNYLLLKEEKSILINVIEHSLKQKEKNIELFYEINQELSHPKSFGLLVIDNWSDIWLSIISYKGLTTEKKNQLLVGLLLCIDDEKLLDKHIEILKNYVDENENIVNSIPVDEESVSKIQRLFVYLQIEFQQLTHCSENIDFVEFIIREELIVIHPSNLLALINIFSDGAFENTFNISDVYELDNVELISLLENNILEISQYLNTDEIEIGSKTQYRNILNHHGIERDIKENTIVKEQYEIDKLSEIDEIYGLWGILFQNNKVKATWANIIIFINSDNYSVSHLISFLNLPSVYSELLNEEADLNEEDEKRFVDCLLNDEITISTFEKLQTVVGHLFNTLDFDRISNDKLNCLINNGDIIVDVSNYKELKGIDCKLSCSLLEEDFDAFLLNVNIEEAGINFDFDELRILFNSSKLTIQHKNILIKELEEELTNASAVILDAVISNLNATPFLKPQISEGLLGSLLKIGTSQEGKVKVYAYQIKNLEPDSQRKFLSQLGKEYHEIVITRSNTTLPDTPYNFQLVQALEQAEIISSYSYTAPLVGDKKLKINAKRRR